MKTNGLVGCATLALSFALVVSSLAQEGAQFVSLPSVDAVMDGSCCTAESDDCYCCDPGHFFFAGVEATFLQTQVFSGGVITASFSDTTAPGVSTFATIDGNGVDHFAYAPRLWLGFQLNENWGVVGRYWDLTVVQSNTPPAPNPAIPNTGTNFATIFEVDNARLYTADIEIVRSLESWGWKIDMAGGYRHAHVGANSDFLAFGVFTTGNFINLTLQNGFGFDGEGATAALMGRYRLGDSPLHFFLGGRFSYLRGETDSYGRSDGTIADSPSAPLVGAATVTRRNAKAELDIAEFQTGVQFDFELVVLPASAFLRAAFEYQFWDVDAPPTGGAGFGGTIGELTTNSFASAGIGDAILYGVSVSTGVNW